MNTNNDHGKSRESNEAAVPVPEATPVADLFLGDKALSLFFTVSRDEEHVDLRAACRGQEWNFGERVHHYPLLLLVRLRVQDQRRGVAPDSAGWVASADLAKMLGMDAAHLHIQMFRMRRQFNSALPPALHRLVVVERRRGQIRAASMSVRIEQGTSVQLEEL